MRVEPGAPALSDTLSVILPTPDQTLLLRVALSTGEAGREAWQAWQDRAGGLARALEDDGPVVKGLLPLLFSAVRRNGVAADRALLTILRTAYVREELRSQSYRRICREVLRLLAMDGIPAVVLKGAALAGSDYGDWALRHSHDLDLLVKGVALSSAADALALGGFRPLGPARGAGHPHLELEHVSGLPVHLHSDPFRIPHANALGPDFWLRSQTATIEGMPARVLSSADNLLHVCGHASSCASRESLRWVCDSWYIIQNGADLAWDQLLEGAHRGQLALPLYVMLRYLAVELRAPIPATVLDRLAAAAARTRTLGREGALYGARLGARGSLKNLLRQSRGWRSRLLVARWMLLPSPDYLYWVERPRRTWLLPLHYLARPMRYGARWIRWSFEARAERRQHLPAARAAGNSSMRLAGRR